MPKISLSLTVTGDLGPFTTGQVLTDNGDIANYYRTITNEGRDVPTKLADTDILAIVASVEGDNEDAEMERVSLIDAGKVPVVEQEGAPAKPKPMSAARKELEAIELGKRSDNNPVLLKHLVQVSDAKQWLSSCAYFIMEDFLSQYTRETMLKWPEIGARSHDENKVATGHPNPDCYRRPTKAKGGGGGGGYAMDYWHKHFAAGLKPIREMIAIIDAQKAAEGSAKLNDRQLAAFVDKYEARIDSATGKVKQAIELFQQLERAAAYPACTISWEKEKKLLWEEDGTTPVIDPVTKRQAFTRVVAEVDRPIYVEDADAEEKSYRQMSIQQLLGLDFAKATEAGGTYDNLMDTIKREPKAPGEDDDNAIVVVDREDALSAINGLASYLSEKANKVALMTLLMNASKEGEAGQDARETLLALQSIADTALGLIAPHRSLVDELEDAAKAKAKVA